MSNKTFYLNPENEEKWEKLENKSLFVNMALNNMSSGTVFTSSGTDKMVKFNSKTVDYTPADHVVEEVDDGWNNESTTV